MTETTADDEAVAVTSTTVTADPQTAFEVFTGGIGRWWRRGTRYWNDSARGLRVEFEPGIGGRFLEVYADGAFEIGRVTAWEPGERLGFTWREETWDADSATTVDVRFEAVDGGTRVTVRHGGWDAAGQRDSAGNYSHGWIELLGWYGEAAAGAAAAPA